MSVAHALTIALLGAAAVTLLNLSIVGLWHAWHNREEVTED